MFRDEARVRADPESTIAGKTLDVKHFFDPAQALHPWELEFAMRVVTEKLKMIFETNPTISHTVDFGQIDRMRKLAHNAEAGRLRETLQHRNRDLAMLQGYVKELEEKLQ